MPLLTLMLKYKIAANTTISLNISGFIFL
jgi:hypothetical protein